MSTQKIQKKGIVIFIVIIVIAKMIDEPPKVGRKNKTKKIKHKNKIDRTSNNQTH